MIVCESANRLVKKQDVIHIAILAAIALVIGVYLIATTTLIAKDGISYINYAKGLATTPLKIIRDCSKYAPKSYTPGYPFLILITHKLVDLFGDGASVLSWIYSAQAIALFCRILALIPLYFIGKEFVGSKLSFWAILILVMLPYPARFGSDALRDWPHMLFLSTSFLLLVRASMQKRWWQFGLVGIITALGYTIRPMCAQLIIYGALWLLYTLLKTKTKYSMPRSQTIAALISLVIGFLAISAPYMQARGTILPTRARQIMESFSHRHDSNEIFKHNDIYHTELVSADTAKALWELIDKISSNLMYFFSPFLFIGMYYYLLRKDVCEPPLKFFIIAFVLLNIMMVIFRYICAGPVLSKRYILPLTAFSVFFVPVGVQVLGRKIDKLICKIFCKKDSAEEGARRWFFVLLVIGLGICIPKLFRPIRIEKEGYRLAAQWLKENTAKQDIVIVHDKRISFYAERKSWILKKFFTGEEDVVVPPDMPVIFVGRKGWGKMDWGAIGKEVEYVVMRLKSNESAPIGTIEVWSSYVNRKKKEDKIVICQRM